MPRFDRSTSAQDEAWHRVNAYGPTPYVGAHRLMDGDFVHLLTGNGQSWIGVVFRDDDAAPGFDLELADDDRPVRIPLRDETVCRLSAYQRRSNLPPRRERRR